jgi:predicted RNA-binding protein (virulence factor B family)
MLQYGKYNTLFVGRRSDNGFYLTEAKPVVVAKPLPGKEAPVVPEAEGEEAAAVVEEVLLPKKFAIPGMKEGKEVTVFVYKDSEDRPVATTQTPLVTVGQAAYLTVKQQTSVGAFLDWGLDKDLFLPFREQSEPVVVGEKYLIWVYFDFASKRIVATSNINKFIKNREVDLKPNEEVDLMICYDNEVGTRVIINQKHWGILFKNEVFQKLEKGEHVKGFVKKVREDGKIDVALQKQGLDAAKDIKEILLQKLKDDSPPEMVHEILGISKKNFKKAVGMLYKEAKIELTDNYIKLK